MFRSSLLRALLMAVPVVGLTTCTPPDRPRALAEPLAEGFEWVLRSDSARTTRVAGGVWYRYFWSSRGPWAIHILEVDLSECAIGFRALTAESVTDRPRSFARLSDMATRGEIVAAVNGDFYMREGLSLGPEVVDGRVRRAPERMAFGWHPVDGPWIGRTRTDDDGRLRVGARAYGVDQEDAWGTVVGGRPALLDGGSPVDAPEVKGDLGRIRHPRTALGFDERGHRLWMVVVDGRQNHSVGVTLPELRELFVALGAHEALNLDGGGSSTMVLAGRVVNRPSDASGERAIVNGIGVVRDPTTCRLSAPMAVAP